MSSAREIELAQADVRYCHDRVALLRAKLYRWVSDPTLACASSNDCCSAPSNTCAMSIRAKAR